MKKYSFLAFDLGATSGRAVIGTLAGDKFEMREIHRFPNAIMELHGRYYWNVFHLYEAMKESLRICARQQIVPDSIGIDTWGVDFGYLAADGTLLGLPRAYRDPYTEGVPEAFFKRVPRSEVYRLTGIQIMNFNSLFQLYKAKQENFAPLQTAKEILFMPDLLSYLLTGNKVCEYTDASTSQLLNPVTKQFEASLLEAAGVSPSLLRPVVMPGTRVGVLTAALANETGIGQIPVIAVAGHDTASAVAAVPAEDREFAYLSSGTWSLMGIETEEPIITEDSFRYNFTNEGGIDGTTRFLKNITGMWLLEQWAARAVSERVGTCRPDVCLSGHSQDGGRGGSVPQLRQSGRPAFCQSAQHDGGDCRLLPRNRAAGAGDGRRVHPLHLRELGDALPGGLGAFVGDGAISNTEAARHWWRVEKQSVEPVYSQRHTHAGCCGACRSDGYRKLHGAGACCRIGRRPLGDAAAHPFFPFSYRLFPGG